MTYDLALKLKNAGFPQPYKKHTDFGKTVYIFGVKGLRIRPRPTQKQYNQMILVGLEVVNLPTLSELIEACGDKIYILCTAIYHEEGTAETINGWACNGMKSFGRTPEIAVAELWLALQANK